MGTASGNRLPLFEFGIRATQLIGQAEASSLELSSLCYEVHVQRWDASKGRYEKEFRNWLKTEGRSVFGTKSYFSKLKDAGFAVSRAKLNSNISVLSLPRAISALYEISRLTDEEFNLCLHDRYSRQSINAPRSMWSKPLNPTPIIHPSTRALDIRQWKREWENPQSHRAHIQGIRLATVYINSDALKPDDSTGEITDLFEIERKLQEQFKGSEFISIETFAAEIRDGLILKSKIFESKKTNHEQAAFRLAIEYWKIFGRLSEWMIHSESGSEKRQAKGKSGRLLPNPLISFLKRLIKFKRRCDHIGLWPDWLEGNNSLGFKMIGGGGPAGAPKLAAEIQEKFFVPGRSKLHKADPARYISGIKSFQHSNQLKQAGMLSNIDLRLLRLLNVLERRGLVDNRGEYRVSRVLFSTDQRKTKSVIEEKPLSSVIPDKLLERRSQGRVAPKLGKREEGEIIYAGSVPHQERLDHTYGWNTLLRNSADILELRRFILDLAARNSVALDLR